MQVPEGTGSPGEGRNKREIAPFQLQGDITPFQLYCLNIHFERSLLGQSAGHKRDGTVSRHTASVWCLWETGLLGQPFLLWDFIKRSVTLPVMQPNSCKVVSKQKLCLLTTATQLPLQRQIAQAMGKINLDLSAKHWVDIPRETSESTGFFSIPGGNNEKYSKFWLTD